jgi:hypothetical protein
MNSYRNFLLAGAAALGLIAGANTAPAQTLHGGGAPQVNQQQTTQPGGAGSGAGGQTGSQTQPGSMSGAQSGNSGTQQNAQGSNPGGNPSTSQNGGNRNAQSLNGNSGHHQHGATANNERRRHGRRSTAERHVPHGLQGNASGQPEHGNQMQGNNAGQTQHGNQMTGSNAGQRGVQTGAGTNVRFSETQRNRIRETIINARNAPRAGQVNFDVRVGTAIPRTEINTIHVIPVPEYLVNIEPRWRGLEYFVFRDSVVIVDPRDLRIVAVVPV